MTNYRITPVKHWGGLWAWYAVRNYAFGGNTPTFYIAKADHYNLVAGERICCWAQAADTNIWNDFDNVNIGETDITFSNDDIFPAGMIYVSHLPMYPFSRIQRKINQWTQNAYVSNPVSATNFIISTQTSRITMDGRTAPALPFYAMKVTSDRVGDKNKAILTAYNHPSETPGAYQLEGALDWLLSGVASAETLLDWFEFWVYPCLNPQAVWSGYFRSQPEDATKDHNREWDANDLETTTAYRSAMNTDTGGTIDVGLDFHSEMSPSDIHGSVETGDTSGNYEYFRAEMAALDADFNLVQSSITDSLRYLWRGTYSASLAMSVEQGGELARNVPNYLTYGENSMKSLYEMLVDGRFTYGP